MREREGPGLHRGMDYDEKGAMKEVELVKGEIGRLKLGMSSMVEEKAKALSTLQQARSKTQSDSATAEALRTQLQIANEEHVLVELARIEATQEAGQIQALRQKGSAECSCAREEIRRKIEKLSREIDASKDLEHQLAVAQADINQLKEMKAAGLGISHLLLSITQELEAAKEQLDSIREEAFLFMSSMDTIRKELERVTREIARLKRSSDSKAKNLNSKLLRAKAKYEAAASAEQKTQSIFLNLSLTLRQLHREAQASKTEKDLITEETRAVKTETQKTESHMSICEERLQVAMRNLEDVKSSEASALDKLKSLIENTLQARSSEQNSTISISKFEYEYLTGRAGKAEEIADQKVAAAQAWIEALEASEKEVRIKVEIAQRNLQEIKMEGERKLRESERSIPAKRKVFSDSSQCLREKQEKTIDEAQKKSLKYGGKLRTPSFSASGQAKLRNSASPATRRSTPVIIKKKKKVITSLAKFFGRKKEIKLQSSIDCKLKT